MTPVAVEPFFPSVSGRASLTIDELQRRGTAEGMIGGKGGVPICGPGTGSGTVSNLFGSCPNYNSFILLDDAVGIGFHVKYAGPWKHAAAQ